ncbi:MAG: tetratricopeptide repeat protein [Candidatus Micrarchaeota archaeon]|nr:tetratricopeptide repeat protein [Candidatus Micrarchaeota archaeon]
MNGKTVSHEIRALVPMNTFKTSLSIMEYAINRSVAKQHIDNASLFIRKDTDRAISELDSALKIDGKNPEALTLMGKALMKKNMMEEALDYFTRAIDADPKNTDAYSLRGMIRHMLGDKEGLSEDMGACSIIKEGNSRAQGNI